MSVECRVSPSRRGSILTLNETVPVPQLNNGVRHVSLCVAIIYCLYIRGLNGRG